jgi:putative component of membrane protein insertase Oxa1/YidC/SpoIIIJ protein YidD
MKLIQKILLLYLSLNTSICLSQQINDFSFFKSHLKNKTDNYSETISKISNTKKNSPVLFFFRFYKKHISTQDYNKCNFHPSCSEYCVIALKNAGLVVGLLSTSDRLQRCNTFSLKQYETFNEFLKKDDLLRFEYKK